MDCDCFPFCREGNHHTGHSASGHARQHNGNSYNRSNDQYYYSKNKINNNNNVNNVNGSNNITIPHMGRGISNYNNFSPIVSNTTGSITMSPTMSQYHNFSTSRPSLSSSSSDDAAEEERQKRRRREERRRRKAREKEERKKELETTYALFGLSD
ncbi:hypothetical protein AC578_269 [Pseudocercospora eumusae]|uniref:Uncharacterized protein n=1 Tax=Pseudocercospora eumusae TaxID=321146 RepID=A0A139H760_9PEZI|nr:hypothetical protein AC578_269 [Pseudocercospora eumusae]